MKDWLTCQSLPLWAGVGFDQDRCVFQERLTLDGQPISSVPRRLMVQARQIYCYAVAERRNWMNGADVLVAKAARSMVRDYYEPDGRPGWVTSVNAEGQTVDDTRDLYAHAFALLGLAAAFQSTRDSYYLLLVDKTLDFMDLMMRHAQGGYLTCLPFFTCHEMMQNPHMHLLEALMALYEVAPKEDYRLRSKSLVYLLEKHLFQTSTNTLCEYFAADWSPLTKERGRFFEPGHHYEWAWLLHRYSVLFGCALSECAYKLVETANTLGSSPEGLLWTEVRNDGQVLNSSIRLWPHTEVIKAQLSLGKQNAHLDSAAWLGLLYETFLKPAFPGGWNDRIATDGRLLAEFMPASSLYHLVCSFSEYEGAAALRPTI